MTRSWIRRATIAGALATAGVCWVVGTFAVAEYDTLLTGVTQSRELSRRGRLLVLKNNNVTNVPGPPGSPLPDDPDPRKPPQTMATSGKVTEPGTGLDGGLNGGVGLMATTSPQTRLETSLKNLARELR